MNGFTLPANLNVYISAAVFVIGAYIFALYAGLIVWTVRDIRRRTRDVLALIMSVLLVGLFTVAGLLVYMLLRPQTTLAEEYERSLAEESLLQDLDDKRVCPNCGRRVEADFMVCPHCHQQLRLRCVGCGRLLSPDWDVCPYCGLYREQDAEVKGKKHRKTAKQAPVQEQAVVVTPPMPAEAEEPEPVAALADDDVYQTFEARAYETSEEDLPHLDADEVTRQLDEIAAEGRVLQDDELDDLQDDEAAVQDEVMEDEIL